MLAGTTRETQSRADTAERRAQQQETSNHVHEESRHGVSVIMFDIGTHARKENAKNA